MPYVRVGKCVYEKNKDGKPGKKKHCFKTAGKAKKYLTALNINVTAKEK